METAFYPVVTVENEEELDILRRYCDDNKIDIQFLDDNLNRLPVQVLLYIDKDDFDIFLSSLRP